MAGARKALMDIENRSVIGKECLFNTPSKFLYDHANQCP